MAFLKNQETEEIFHLDKPSILLSNKPHSNLSPSKYKIFENISFQTKHAAILETSDKRHQLVDLCSEETNLLRKNGTEIALKAMQFYDLEDGNILLIGNQKLVYQQIENSYVIGPSQIEMISNNQPHLILKRVQFEVPGTEETDDEFENGSENLEDIEIPETPEQVNLDDGSNEELNEDLLMETQPQFYDLEDKSARDDNLDLMTQPFFNLPPATRFRAKQQNALKPNTRSLAEFEATQANNGNFYMETQPFEVAANPRLKSPFGLRKVVLPPKKVNKILLSSSESESSNGSDSEEIKTYASEGTTDEVLFKMSMSQSPLKNPLKVESIMQTPGMLPKVPSQILMDTDLLEKVNSSQSINDDAILDLKGESDDIMNVPVHETSSYKRPRTQLELKPKKKVKFMKYASDEEN